MPLHFQRDGSRGGGGRERDGEMYIQAESGGRGGEGETVQSRVRCTIRGKVLEVGVKERDGEMYFI